jgi:hypothetical protein
MIIGVLFGGICSSGWVRHHIFLCVMLLQLFRYAGVSLVSDIKLCLVLSVVVNHQKKKNEHPTTSII